MHVEGLPSLLTLVLIAQGVFLIYHKHICTQTNRQTDEVTDATDLTTTIHRRNNSVTDDNVCHQLSTYATNIKCVTLVCANYN